MLKRNVSLILSSFLLISSTFQPAAARGGFAKDIVEEGYWNAGVIGGSVHVYRGIGNYPHAVVIDWNPQSEVVRLRYDDGSIEWVWAGNVYSEAQTTTAKQDEDIGIGLGALGLCALFCPSGRNSGDSSGGSNDDDSPPAQQDDPVRDQQQQDNTNHQTYCPGDPQGPLGHPCPN